VVADWYGPLRSFEYEYRFTEYEYRFTEYEEIRAEQRADRITKLRSSASVRHILLVRFCRTRLFSPRPIRFGVDRLERKQYIVNRSAFQSGTTSDLENRLRRLHPWKTELKSEQNVSIAPSPIVY